MAGLALALGFTDRTAFWRFLNESKHLQNGSQKKRETIFNTLKSVKSVIEDMRVRDMLTGRNNTAAAIFDLKNNFGYLDKVEVVQDTHMTVTWEGLDALDVTPKQLPDETQDS